MGLKERLAIYDKIEAHREHPVVVYVTSKRKGVDAQMATDALPYLIDQLDMLPAKTDHVDLLIASYGGDPMVAWRIMSLLRERVAKVSVLIPQSAYSAATLLALGADEIVMHPNGHLGPVDMQITTFAEGMPQHFSTEDISAFLDFVRENLSITDQRHLRRLFEITCKEVGSLGVGLTARSSKLAVALGERLLGMHMRDDDNGNRRKVILEKLSRQFHSHAYPVSRAEAIGIQLAVNKERDTALETLMWQLWLDLEEELEERRPFEPIMQLLNSSEATKLLAPVPQLNLPLNALGPNIQAALGEVASASTTEIYPVDFDCIDAIMESSRLANWGIRKGRILACRLPDLSIEYNTLVTFSGWTKMHPRSE